MSGFRLLLLLLACIAEVAMANLYDGLPRPPGYPRVPTKEYGPTPPCYLNGTVVKCEWYGFAHIDYLPESVECLAVTRAALANTTLAPPGSILPYSYYLLNIYLFDPANNYSYCIYGCFDMSGAGTPPGMAPSPATVATPPPATVATPPPASIPPPPAPSVLVPPPPTLSGPPPGALAPVMTTPPPPPSGTRVVNLSGAGFLQPRGIVSFVISGALLVHGILAF